MKSGQDLVSDLPKRRVPRRLLFKVNKPSDNPEWKLVLNVKPTINLQEKPEYLRFDYVETNPTLDAGIQTFSAIAEECRLRGTDKALVVGKLTAAPSRIDVYNLAKRLAQLFRGMKIAYVLASDEHFSAAKFGEDVAVNRGAVARIFQNEREAERWLVSA